MSCTTYDMGRASSGFSELIGKPARRLGKSGGLFLFFLFFTSFAYGVNERYRHHMEHSGGASKACIGVLFASGPRGYEVHDEFLLIKTTLMPHIHTPIILPSSPSWSHRDRSGKPSSSSQLSPQMYVISTDRLDTDDGRKQLVEIYHLAPALSKNGSSCS